MKTQKLKLITSIILTSVMMLNTCQVFTNVYAQEKTKAENKILFNAKDELEVSSEISASQRISPDIDTTTNELVKIIVEFKETPVAVQNYSKSQARDSKGSIKILEEEHNNFKKQLNSKSKSKSSLVEENIELNYEYFYAFNGIAMTMPGNLIESLLEFPQVSKVWKDREVSLPDITNEETMNAKTIMESFPQIGVDRLHDEGITGKGIKVGILDTGIDYNHPDLKDVYKGGYDLINMDDDPMETTYEDWVNNGYMPEYYEGTSFYTFHGTHVAGTIAGQAKNNSTVKAEGVAPEVDIYAYKVLGEYSLGDNSIIIAGIDKAVQDGMDIINLSLGSSINHSLEPTSIAINNAAKAGVIPVVAAGNSGPQDYTMSSPGVSPFAITVGASNTEVTIPTFNGVFNEDLNINFKLLANNYDYNLESLKEKKFEIVYCGLGKLEDFTEKDLKGKIALIERGEIPFVEKIANAKEAGAEAVFVYNNLDGYIDIYLDTAFEFIPTFNLTKADGEKLVNSNATNNTVTFKEMSSEIQEGDILADFSSRGPVANSLEIKPDVVAPGVNILSTYPEFINNPQEGEDYSTAYNKISGTSMATPHVTGVVALMLSEAKKAGEELSVSDVKTILMNTADELNGDYSVYEKGAGRINAYEAVKNSIMFKVKNMTQTIEDDENEEVVEIETISGALQFGSTYKDGKDKNLDKTITISNNSDEDKKFSLAIYHTTPKGLILDSDANGVKLTMPEEITVPAGKSLEVPLSLIVPATSQCGFYEGVLKFSNISNSKEDYVIPYAVKYSEKGIKSYNLTKNVMAIDPESFHLFSYPIVGYEISYNSPMKNQKLYIKDATTGKRIGFITEYENISVVPDTIYTVFTAFRGKYMPMIGDYIENRIVTIEPGHYKLEVEAIDFEGDVYNVEQDLFIDNTPPEIILEEGNEFGIHELSEEDFTVEDGIKAYYIKGRLYDDTITKLNDLGYTHDLYGEPITQQLNQMLYYQQLPNERSPFYSGTINIDSEGRFNIGVTPEEVAENPLELSLFSYDYGTAADYNEEKFSVFIKEGQGYGDITYDKSEVTLGDIQTGHMSLKNIKALTKLEYVIGFDAINYDLESITVNEEFKAYAEAQGLKVKISSEPTSDMNIENIGGEAYKVTLEVMGSANGIDINEKMPVVDIKAKVVNDTSIGVYSHVFYTKTNSENKYTDATGAVNQLYIMSYINSYTFIPKTTRVALAFISAEGFFDENGWSNWSLDYSKMNAEAYVITPDGQRHDATINQGGEIEAVVPANIEECDFYVEVPGHFQNKIKVQLGKLYNGEVVAISRRFSILTAYAGDMNGDNIIDNKDKELLNADLGKTTSEEENYLTSDINKDRIVDEKDMTYITKNFGMVNPRLIEDAEVAVATLKVSQDLNTLQNAMDKINLLPESDKKEELLNRVKEITGPIYINIATQAVEKAEEVRTQEAVDSAKVLVEALSDSEAKKSLLERLNVVQEAINATALENAKDAVEKAEATKAQADVDAARALVNSLKDSKDKTNLNKRLDKVQEEINLKIAIEEATKAVEKAEKTKNKNDIKAAKALVNKLPKGKVKDELLNRLKNLSDKLPQTGAMVGTTGAVALGGVLLVTGVIVLKKRKIEE